MITDTDSILLFRTLTHFAQEFARALETD